jgi:hypothetical protein
MITVIPRPLRIQYAGARYHVMSRGDRREAIFYDDADRKLFLDLLGQVCRLQPAALSLSATVSQDFT